MPPNSLVLDLPARFRARCWWCQRAREGARAVVGKRLGRWERQHLLDVVRLDQGRRGVPLLPIHNSASAQSASRRAIASLRDLRLIAVGEPVHSKNPVIAREMGRQYVRVRRAWPMPFAAELVRLYEAELASETPRGRRIRWSDGRLQRALTNTINSCPHRDAPEPDPFR